MNDTIKQYFNAFNAGDVDGMLACPPAPLAAAIAPFAGWCGRRTIRCGPRDTSRLMGSGANADTPRWRA